MTRPSPFKILDALTFGLLSVAMTGLAIYVQTTPQTTQAYALTWTVAAAFWAIYVGLIYVRARFIAKFPIMLTGGIMVNPENYLTAAAVLDREVQRTLKLYENVGFSDAINLISKSTTWLTFRPGPFPHPQNYKVKVAGFITAGGEGGQIGYTSPDQPIEQTAFAHELGHIILGRAWKDWDMARHHAFMKEHGLP